MKLVLSMFGLMFVEATSPPQVNVNIGFSVKLSQNLIIIMIVFGRSRLWTLEQL